MLLSGAILYFALSRPGPNGKESAPLLPEKGPAILPDAEVSGLAPGLEALDRAEAESDGPASPEGREQDLEEPARGPCSFLSRLVDGKSGNPLANETVKLAFRQARSSRPLEVKTDGGGRLRIGGLAPGVYSLETRHPDYLADLRVVELLRLDPERQGPEPEEIEIRLVPAAKLHGEVVDSTGQPISNAKVRLALLSEGGPENAASRSEPEGSFSVSGLRPGKWNVSAFHPGYRRASLEVEVPSSASIRLLLPHDPGFDVLVTDPRGAPLPGARVSLLSRSEGFVGAHRSGVTQANGKIHLDGFQGEGALIRVNHQDYLTAEKAATEAEAAGGFLQITLSQGAKVSGRVLDGNERPVSGAQVELFREDGSTPGPRDQLKATAGGAFQFKKVPPGKYEVAASAPLLGSAVLSGVEVDAGGLENLEVRLQAGAGIVAGRVRDAQGKGLARCQVTLAPEHCAEKRGARILRTMSGPDGAFRFEGLPLDGDLAYRVTARGKHLAAATQAGVLAGETNVEIMTGEMGSIAGLVAVAGPARSYVIKLETDGPARAGEGKERAFRFSSRDLWFRLQDIAPGTYTVSLVIDNEVRGEARGVQVMSGQETGPVKLGETVAH
jgi:hypothetical protein